MTPEELVELQKNRETQAYAEAVNRYNAACAKLPLEKCGPGMALVRKGFQALHDAIMLEQGKILAGASPRCWQELIAVPPEKMAVITLNTIVHAMGEKDRYGLPKFAHATMVQRRIGEACHVERLYGSLTFAQKRVFDAVLKRNRRLSDAKRRAAEQLEKFREADISVRDAIHVGGRVVALAVEKTGLFELQQIRKRPKRIVLTSDAVKYFEEVMQLLQSLLRPRFQAMVAPPKPWKPDGTEGGFLEIGQPLVKREDELVVGAALDRADLRIPCEAVNALQATPFRLNRRIYELFQKVWGRREPKELLPLLVPPPMPPYIPKPKDKDRKQAKLHAKRKRERNNVRGLIKAAINNRIRMAERLTVCEDLAQFEQFWFPPQLDWRGREYPVPQGVQPQGDDLQKALLEFAIAKPLGERGAEWLAIELASLYGRGMDKAPFRDRIEWVQARREAIIACVERPFDGPRLWLEAEEKWRFQACADDWAKFALYGPETPSRFPLAVDGTCNVLQHCAALGRDAEGALWTNVLPGPQPQDIYGRVAGIVEGMLRARKTKRAREWLQEGVLSRSLVKRATMTTPYGITMWGVRAQLRSFIRENFFDKFEDETKAAHYLAKRVVKAIAQVCVKAVEIRKWLQEVVTKFAEKGLGIYWTVPTGFCVPHHYFEEVGRRVGTVTGALLIKQSPKGAGIDLVKQRLAVAANVIHSLDAAHMMLTVVALRAAGLADYAMVHDSYAVHACDVDLMARILREQFIRVHTEFTLAKLYEDLKRQAPGIELPPPPTLGTLDLAQVRASEYFFS